MDRHIPDDQLDRTFARYFVERGDEIGLSARSAEQAASRLTGVRRPRAGLDHRARMALVLALTAVALAAAAAIVGSQPRRPSLPALIPAERGTFTAAGEMLYLRDEPSLTLLEDGRVLVIGGYKAGNEAEVWDPRSGVFSSAGRIWEARWGHAAARLKDGRVLVVGGRPGIPDPNVPEQGMELATAEVWDPATMTFTRLPSPSRPRFEGTAELQPDGRVLISGGSDNAGDDPVPSEYWDPTTGIFAPVGKLTGSVRPAGTVLDDGRVLVLDEFGASLWDPTTRTSQAAGQLHQARSLGATETLLADGRVLVSGGESSSSAGPLSTAELWDPATLAFDLTGPLVVPRSLHAAVLLRDGRVLIVGADIYSAAAHSAEVFELR